MKSKSKNPLLNRDTYLDDTSFKREQDQLASEILAYKMIYCSIAFYCAMSNIFTVPSVVLNVRHKDEDLNTAFVYNGLSFFGPCLLRPLFGWIGDWYFPFGYRLKGYCIFNCLINIALISTFHFYLTEGSFSFITFMIKLNSVWLEAVALGVTSITIEMERRLILKQNPYAKTVKERLSRIDYPANNFVGYLGENSVIYPSYVRSYGQFMLTYSASKMFWTFVSYLIYLNLFPCYQQGADYKDKFGSVLEADYAIPKLLFLVASSVLIVCLLLFNEKKMMKTYWPENKGKHIFKGFKGIFLRKKSVLIIITLIVIANPLLNACSIIYPYSKMKFEIKNHSMTLMLLSPNFTATIIVFSWLTLIVIFAKRIRPVSYIVFLVLPSLFYLAAIFLFTYAADSAIFSTTYYLWAITCMAVGMDNLLAGLSKIFIIDSFIKQIPRGHEFFYVNLLTTVASAGKQLGVILWVAYVKLFDVAHNTPSKMRPLVHGCLAIFVLLPTALYYLILPKSVTRKDDKAFLVTDGELPKDSNWIIEEGEAEGETEAETKETEPADHPIEDEYSLDRSTL